MAMEKVAIFSPLLLLRFSLAQCVHTKLFDLSLCLVRCSIISTTLFLSLRLMAMNRSIDALFMCGLNTRIRNFIWDIKRNSIVSSVCGIKKKLRWMWFVLKVSKAMKCQIRYEHIERKREIAKHPKPKVANFMLIPTVFHFRIKFEFSRNVSMLKLNDDIFDFDFLCVCIYICILFIFFTLIHSQFWGEGEGVDLWVN